MKLRFAKRFTQNKKSSWFGPNIFGEIKKKSKKKNDNEKLWTKSTWKQNKKFKTKMILEIEPSVACSIKPLATNRFIEAKPPTRFLMVRCLQNYIWFIYDLIDFFTFRTKLWKKLMTNIKMPFLPCFNTYG